MTLLLSERDLAQVVGLEDAYAAAVDAFEGLAHGTGVLEPRLRLHLPAAALNMMAAADVRAGVMGLKAYSVVGSGTSKGTGFTLQLFDIASGELVAILAADGLGNLRTGAASAVATRTLARPDSQTLSVIGTGWVARGQVDAVVSALPQIRTVLVSGRDPARTEAFVAGVRGRTGLEVESLPAAAAVAAADIVVTATSSAEPVLRGGWLQPGTHVNAVGSNAAGRAELDADAVRRADVVVVDHAESASRECGDLLATPAVVEPLELGAVLTGAAVGRTDSAQVTLFESQGIAVLDVALGARALALARRAGIGTDIGDVLVARPGRAASSVVH